MDFEIETIERLTIIRYLTKKQAAEILNVTPRTIDHLRTNCGLPSYLLDRAVRIPEDGLREWLEARTSSGVESHRKPAKPMKDF